MSALASTLTIRNFDLGLKNKLRVLAANQGRSMEEQVRVLLRQALSPVGAKPEQGFGDMLRQHFAPIGGIDLALPKRTGAVQAVVFDWPQK